MVIGCQLTELRQFKSLLPYVCGHMCLQHWCNEDGCTSSTIGHALPITAAYKQSLFFLIGDFVQYSHNTYSSLQERTVRQMFMCMLTELVWPMEFVVVMGLSASAKQLVKNCFT